MSGPEEIVTREDGYLLFIEGPAGATCLDRVYSLKDVAKWVIDEHDYYLSHETMHELDEITKSGGLATVEFDSKLLTVAFSKAAPEPNKENAS